jgi:hypothetical protein
MEGSSSWVAGTAAALSQALRSTNRNAGAVADATRGSHLC